jgi:hypothetical protein
LGAFGIREHEEGERRLQEAGERLRDERLLPEGQGGEPIVEREATTTPNPAIEEIEAGPSSPTRITSQPQPEESSIPARPPISRDESSRGNRPPNQRRKTGEGPGEWTDVDDASDTTDSSDIEDGEGKRGWSLWGPLKKWRLADRSQF